MLLNITVTTLWMKGNHLQTHLTLRKHEHAADETFVDARSAVGCKSAGRLSPHQAPRPSPAFIDKSEISIPHMTTPLLSVHGSFMM